LQPESKEGGRTEVLIKVHTDAGAPSSAKDQKGEFSAARPIISFAGEGEKKNVLNETGQKWGPASPTMWIKGTSTDKTGGKRGVEKKKGTEVGKPERKGQAT